MFQTRRPLPAWPSSQPLRPLTWAVRCALAGLMVCSAAQAADPAAAAASVQADDPSLHSYALPAGPLGAALSGFASQSGLLLSFDPALTRGRDVPALVGRYTVSGALRQLLAGTDLQWLARPDGSYALVAASQASVGAVTLPSVVVVGDGLSPSERQVYTAPRSSVHLSSQALDRFGRGVSPADLLQGVPGVQMGDSRNGGALDVNIRGIQGQSRVAVKVDGSQQAQDVYRGYAGMQQRSYIDADLISNVTINKGPTLNSGAIGGTVEMRTLGVQDILVDGKRFGLRLKGDLWNNGLSVPYRDGKPLDRFDTGSSLQALPRNSRAGLFGSRAESGSLALAYTDPKLDIVAAYARRNQGNYLAGSKGWERYRSFDRYGREVATVAKNYKPGEEVLNSSNQTESLMLKTTIRPAQGHTLELGYRRYDGRNGEIMPSDIYRYQTAGLFQYPLSEVKLGTYTARYQFQPANNPLVDLTSHLWLTDTSTSVLNAVRAPTSQAYRTDRNWSRQTNRRIGGDLANVSRFSTDYGEVKLDLGGSFQVEDMRPQKGVVITQHDINADRKLRDARRQEFGLSGKLQYQPVDRLTLWAGGRYAYFRTVDRGILANARREDRTLRIISVSKRRAMGTMFWYPDQNGQYTDATDPRLHNGLVSLDTNYPLEGVNYNDFGATNSRVGNEQVYSVVTGYDYDRNRRNSGSGFSPSVGFQLELMPSTFFYASYTQGLRLPSMFETSEGTLSLEGGRNLKPERSNSWEIGASTLRQGVLTERDRVGLKVAYFNNDVKNYINRYYNIDNGWMKFTNAERYKTSGLEFQSQYDAGRVFADLSATYYLNTETCDAAYAAKLRARADRYNQTQNTPNCTPASYMGSYANTQNPPKLSVNLTAGLRLFDETLTMGGRVTYTSGPTVKADKPWQVSATTPQRVYHPQTLVNLFMNYKLREHTTVSLAVRNLTNRYYLDPLALSFMPAPGRTLFVGMQTQF